MGDALKEFWLAVGDLFFELAGMSYRKAGEAWRYGEETGGGDAEGG